MRYCAPPHLPASSDRPELQLFGLRWRAQPAPPSITGCHTHPFPFTNLHAGLFTRQMVTAPRGPVPPTAPRPHANTLRHRPPKATVTLPTLSHNRGKHNYPLRGLSAWYEQARRRRRHHHIAAATTLLPPPLCCRLHASNTPNSRAFDVRVPAWDAHALCRRGMRTRSTPPSTRSSRTRRCFRPPPQTPRAACM